MAMYYMILSIISLILFFASEFFKEKKIKFLQWICYIFFVFDCGNFILKCEKGEMKWLMIQE